MRIIRRLSVVGVAAAALLLVGVAAPAYWPPPPQALRTIKCESRGGKSTYCHTGTYGPVRLQRQLSGTPCVQYETWGVDADGGGVWVWNGCRATFLVGGGWGPPRPGHGGRPPHSGDGGRTVTCKSDGFSYNHCAVGRVRDVRLQKNLSDTRCVRNDNWGVDRRGIWVDRGCAARFTIY